MAIDNGARQQEFYLGSMRKAIVIDSRRASELTINELHCPLGILVVQPGSRQQQMAESTWSLNLHGTRSGSL
jgi:hypothetical protein